MNINLDDLNDLGHVLSSANHVLIVTHQYPDHDALGSSLAWHFQLDRLGISNTVWTADNIGDQFTFMPGSHSIQHVPAPLSEIDVVLALDSSNLNRIRDYDKLGIDPNRVTLINVDHHPDNTRFGHMNFVFDISSVGEASFNMFQKMDWPISDKMATCLYSAIVFDTGSFMNVNVTAATFKVASELLEAGADIHQVTRSMWESYKPSDYDAVKVALDRLEIRDGYAFTSIPRNITEGPIKVVDYIRKLKDIQVAIVFREADDALVKINLRSKTEFNVSKFAGIFDGGGHRRASGIVIKDSLQVAIETVTARLDAALQDDSFFNV